MPEELQALFEGNLVFNGINAVTGDYGQPPLSPQQLVRLIQGAPSPEDYKEFVARQKRLATLAQVEDRLTRVGDIEIELQQAAAAVRLEELKFKARRETPWPVKPGAGDLSRIEDVGWGVIFPAEMNPTLRESILEALQPLLTLRQSQAGDRFHIYSGGTAYRPGERKDQYCQRLGVGPGLADPDEMPFYIMLVGTPDEIPYSFQYQLDVMRGVGRLDFGSDVEAYDVYARYVVAAESGGVLAPRRAALFAPVNPGDRATALSEQYLVRPLYENLMVPAPNGELALTHDWDVASPFLGEGQATHAQLARLLGGDPAQKPALLFTASHGVEFPASHPAQLQHQGALLCQDWPGPEAGVHRGHYFTGEDVPAGANLEGMIAFFFACYGAGTPELDQFAAQAFKVREKIAARSFTAALPQRMLTQGALAVLGHVERAWGYSFISPSGTTDNQTFITAMRLLMNGNPVGMATDSSFNMKYAELSSDLSADLDELKWNPDYMGAYELAHRWTANNDARSYVVIGDPAVRLPVERIKPAPDEQPDLGTVGRLPTEPTPEAPGAPEAPLTSVGEGHAPVGHAPAVAGAPPVVREPDRAIERAKLIDLSNEPTAVAFGLSDQFAKLRESLRAFTSQLADSLGKAAEDIVTLDVRTYSASDLRAVAESLDAHREIEATLRAMTRVAFDGDVKVYVPERLQGGADQTLWMIHKAMVEEAQQSRARFLATMAELATRLLESLKIGP